MQGREREIAMVVLRTRLLAGSPVVLRGSGDQVARYSVSTASMSKAAAISAWV